MPNEPSPRNRQIIRRLIDGETFQSVADDLGISRQRVHQIARKYDVRLPKGDDKPFTPYERRIISFIESEPRLSYSDIAELAQADEPRVRRLAKRAGLEWIRYSVYRRGIRPWDYDEDPVTGCWIWRYGKHQFGHGRLNAGGNGHELAHRFSYRQHHGSIPKGAVVIQTCRNHACVNPQHLESHPRGKGIALNRSQPPSHDHSPILYQAPDHDGVAVITLNNPQRRNALSLNVLTALDRRLSQTAQDSAVRVVVIRAQGPIFSSGHDLNELINADAADYAAVFDACTGVMENIRLMPQPVIAQVQGLATAAGCQLVATCDIAIAADTAHFATPGVQIGLFCTTPGVAVARAVMPKKAMEMLLTGQPITAHDALHSGLISRVAPPDRLASQTMDLARQIAASSAHTLALGKAAFYRQIEMSRPDAYQFASRVMVDNLLSDDAKEGITAFLAKRPPVWNN